MSDVTPRLDLRPDHWDIVRGILRRHVPGRKVLAFGSRATWTAKEYSDLDLAVLGDKPLPLDVASALAESFVESDLPFKVDVVDWASTSKNFRKVIERDYVVLVEKEERRGVDEWKSTTLDDLIEIKHGFAFKGHSIHEKPCGDVLLTPGNFAIGGGFKNDKFKYYDGSAPEEYILDEGDLLVTMTDLSKQSDTLGYPAYVPSRTDGRRYLHNQRLGKISLKEASRVDGRYIYYVMCGTEYRHEVLASATGTTVKHTSPDRIKQFRFLLPPLPEQCAIAHILGTLDDKIELNRRMNETLEAMARALFKSWFVDFEPVRTKMEGRDTGLPKHIADLFPERMVNSDLGEIPEGWEVSPLDEIATFQNGLALQKYRPQENEEWLPVVKIADLRNGKAAGLEKATSNIRPECIIEDGDVIFSWSGSLIVKIWCGGRAALNQHLFKVTSTKFPKWFFWHCLHSHLENFQSIAADKATTMGHIKRHHLSEAMCSIPDSRLLALADNLQSTFFDKSISINVQSRSLVALRDALLPKLVSGEICLRNAEKIMRVMA